MQAVSIDAAGKGASAQKQSVARVAGASLAGTTLEFYDHFIYGSAAALVFHDIHHFTEGRGGSPANVDLCEQTLQLGESYGITPFSWADKPDDSAGQAEQEAAAPEPSKPSAGTSTPAKDG